MAGNPETIQNQLWVSASIEHLNETRGVIDIPLQEIGVNPEARVNLSTLVGAYGELFNKDALVTTAQSDHALHVFNNDFHRARPENIRLGLYIPPTSDYTRRAQDSLITISHQPCKLEAKGVVGQNVGVVFPPDEFKVVARNAADFVKTVKNKTRAANKHEIDREEVTEKQKRSAAHAMRSKIISLDQLEEEIVQERIVLGKVYRQTKSTWGAQYKAKNLDRDRKQADELIHETAEIAGTTFNLGTVAMSALHRAITSNMYRRGSRTDLNHHWAQYVELTGQYANARRGKIWQSRADCLQQLGKYAHSLIPTPA